MSHETQRGKNTSYAQADHGLQSTLESGVNSDTDHGAYYVNPIRNDRPPTHREYSGSQGNACGDAVLSNAQAGVGLRSSAQTVQNSQTENLGLRAGSGDNTSSLQNNGGPITDMTSILQNFCALISQQNETQNALISQLDDRISKQNESQNNMMRECLTGITNVVRENTNVVREHSTSVKQCMNGIAEQLSSLTGLMQSSCKQAGTREVTQVHENITHYDAVTSVESCRSSNTVASNGIRHSDHSSVNEPYCHVNRRDSLPAIQVSESQTYTRHAGQINSSRPNPGDVCGPSDMSELRNHTRGAVPRLAKLDEHHTVFIPSVTNIKNTNAAANTSGPHEAFSHNSDVKLPVFSGNSSESWKVWFSRFTTVANLNNWDEPTRLSELVQKLQGTAAYFVFDELPQEIVCNFQSLVHELSLRFQTVETNKTFRAQFGKRTQRVGESVEDYCAELKRIYDKAYPGRNLEMRRQLLLQQFLNGLRDKQAKFAVEYFKEPGSIEDAVHNVVTYMEPQEGPKFDDSRNRNHSKSVRFLTGSADGDEADDDSSDDDGFGNRANISGLLSSSSGHREKPIVRRVQTAPPDSSMLSQILNYVAAAIAERKTCHESKSNKTQVTPRGQDQLPSHEQLRPHNQNKGQTRGQGQMRPHQQG